MNMTIIDRLEMLEKKVDKLAEELEGNQESTRQAVGPRAKEALERYKKNRELRKSFNKKQIVEVRDNVSARWHLRRFYVWMDDRLIDSNGESWKEYRHPEGVLQFTEWKGGTAPSGGKVIVKLRDGRIELNYVSRFQWLIMNDKNDIVAYILL